MKHTWLGRTGVRISELVMGTMAFGNEADEEESARLFDTATDAGVNTFDCADVYQGGRSEEILGRLVRERGCRDEIVLATKAYFPTSQDHNARGSSRYHLVRAVEASLERLDTDRVDLFFLHRYDDVTALDETLRAVDDLVRQGKILYPAASNFSAWQTSKALGLQAKMGLSPLVAVQPMYNLVKRQAEVEILPMARAEQLAVLPYSPLGGGLLTGRYGVGRRPDAGRLIDVPMYSTRYSSEQNYRVADAFCALAAELGHDPVTLAVAWVRSHPAVTAPLIGARDVEQLRPSLAAAELDLDEETRERITALSQTPPPATDRNEETSAHNFGSR